jgi:NAD(P)-dependent dehydrogenase (short-subunit alcohol dehydrogenase family)
MRHVFAMRFSRTGGSPTGNRPSLYFSLSRAAVTARMSEALELTSFSTDMRVVVAGAGGGIGSAMVELLAASPRVAKIFALTRSRPSPSRHKVESIPFELQHEASIATAAERCGAGGPLDLILVATGVLHAGDALSPEKSWRALNPQSLAQSFAVNAIGPALLAKHFLELLRPQEKSVFAALSARVGSIGDNRLGGWHSYRASKAALHMLIRTCAIELARRNPSALCIALHPGTVDTALSQPFQANVPEEKLFTPAHAAERLLQVVDALNPPDSGFAFAWDGQRIPF